MTKRRILLAVTFILFIYCLLSYNRLSKSSPDYVQSSMYLKLKLLLENQIFQCYKAGHTNLPDISKANPAPDRSIFFHETSCSSYENGRITINARQACAVESTARLNPNFEIYLLYISSGFLRFNGSESDRFLQALLSYDNVNIHRINFEKYFEGSPVETLLKEKKLEKSSFPHIHVSDVLRYLTLWKYGGIYLDLDVVAIKPLGTLPLNFAGLESWDQIATGVIRFSSFGEGHNVSTHCLEDLRDNFDGSQWSHNSNGVLTRVLTKDCNSSCLGNFTQYPSEKFYPIPWYEWEKYFNSSALQEVETKSNDSIFLHVWNKMSSGTRVRINNTDVPYLAFARRYCPRVFSQCKEFF